MKDLNMLKAYLIWTGVEQRPKSEYVQIDITEQGKILSVQFIDEE